jgi:Sec-independent protein translocase protein TatA
VIVLVIATWQWVIVGVAAVVLFAMVVVKVVKGAAAEGKPENDEDDT